MLCMLAALCFAGFAQIGSDGCDLVSGFGFLASQHPQRVTNRTGFNHATRAGGHGFVALSQ
jgi:hypothetical protein